MGKIVTTGQEMWDLAAYRKLSNEAGRYNIGFVRNRTPGYHRLSEMVLDAYVWATEYPSCIVSVSLSEANYTGRDSNVTVQGERDPNVSLFCICKKGMSSQQRWMCFLLHGAHVHRWRRVWQQLSEPSWGSGNGKCRGKMDWFFLPSSLPDANGLQSWGLRTTSSMS